MTNLKERTQKLNASLAKLEELIAQNKPTEQSNNEELVQKHAQLEQAYITAQKELTEKTNSINALQEKNDRAIKEVEKLIEQIEG